MLESCKNLFIVFQEVFHFVLAFCGFVFLKTLIKEFNFDRLFFGSKLEQLIHFSLRYGVGNNACLVILLLLRLPWPLSYWFWSMSVFEVAYVLCINGKTHFITHTRIIVKIFRLFGTVWKSYYWISWHRCSTASTLFVSTFETCFVVIISLLLLKCLVLLDYFLDHFHIRSSFFAIGLQIVQAAEHILPLIYLLEETHVYQCQSRRSTDTWRTMQVHLGLWILAQLFSCWYQIEAILVILVIIQRYPHEFYLQFLTITLNLL